MRVRPTTYPMVRPRPSGPQEGRGDRSGLFSLSLQRHFITCDEKTSPGISAANNGKPLEFAPQPYFDAQTIPWGASPGNPPFFFVFHGNSRGNTVHVLSEAPE